MQIQRCRLQQCVRDGLVKDGFIGLVKKCSLLFTVQVFVDVLLVGNVFFGSIVEEMLMRTEASMSF